MGESGEDLAPRDLREGVSGVSRYKRDVGEILSSFVWVTPLLIVANVLVFAAMAETFNSVRGFNPTQLAVWGGNSGILDLGGQWWRLVTYQFLHANLIHVAINMWVLWSVGRLTERLYGSVVLLFIYLMAGTLAGLASIVWNPDLVSVGASGSIFGVLGAFLAFTVRSRDEAPVSVLRQGLPVLLFVAFNFYDGVYEPGVDNAAHVGGLLGGLCLGAVMVRSFDHRRWFPLGRAIAATLLACACAVPALWYLGAFERRPSSLDEFAATHRWYADHESQNLLQWQNLGAQVAAGTLSNDEANRRFSSDILPFWKNADARLGEELKQPAHDRNPFLPVLADFARARLALAQAVIAAARDNNPQNTQAVLYDVQQLNLIQAHIDRLHLRAAADSLPTPLGESAIALSIKNLFPAFAWRCIDTPAAVAKPLAPTDAGADGPAARHAAGCAAQRMFVTGDYAALDARMREYSRSLADLPDGSSRLQGVWSGLGDLFEYGKLSVNDALRRTAQWRRSVPGSVEPDLVEADMFRTWAYTARGHGYASNVSPEAMNVFEARAEMAAVGLREATAPGSGDPAWYELSLATARDEAVPVEKQRAIFDQGVAKFPDYFPLYRQMLTSLMPRWSGSDNLVDSFIRDVSKRKTDGQIDTAIYAHLYLTYGNLEGDDDNVIESAGADSKLMKDGLAKLRARYPQSDYILNSVARFACIDNEYFVYKSLRPQMNGRLSATAWPDKLTIAFCDKWAG